MRLASQSQPFLVPTNLFDSLTQNKWFLNGHNSDSLTFFKKNVLASYYHNKFEGKKTSSGEIFSNAKFTAAHKTLPFGTLLKITNVANNKTVVVKVNDRGPFSKSKEIDLSQSAFLAITNSLTLGQLTVHIQEVK